MSKHRVRTQTGHKLYIYRAECYAPGETTEMELTAAQLEAFTADGRIMVDDQIDAFEAELKAMGARKPHGTRVDQPTPRPDEHELKSDKEKAPGFFKKAAEKATKRKRSKAKDLD